MAKAKHQRPEFEGKSEDYKGGYESADVYFNHIYKGGNRLGFAPYRIFVEAVAESIRKHEKIDKDRVESLELILNWSDTEFNKGVHDLLVKRVKEYNANVLIDEVIQKIEKKMHEYK